ncbi:uncharacterized protein [Temnothorax longispinosus]
MEKANQLSGNCSNVDETNEFSNNYTNVDVTEDNQLSRFQKVKGTNMLTADEDLEHIQMYDRTVEIVGYVDGIEAPRKIGDDKQYKFFKFYLNNGKTKRIQVVVWNEIIESVEFHIQPNSIIHLDGALARPPKFAHYNSGNVPYELQICSNTVVSSLGKYEFNTVSDVLPERVEFNEVINTSKRVILVGYVKTKFGAVHHNKFNKLIGCGSLTDGEFKLQVYIINFKEDEYDKFDLNKGDKMEAIGVMQTAEPPYFLIQNLRDIKRVDGCLPLETVIKVSRSLKKRCSEGNSVQDSFPPVEIIGIINSTYARSTGWSQSQWRLRQRSSTPMNTSQTGSNAGSCDQTTMNSKEGILAIHV